MMSNHNFHFWKQIWDKKGNSDSDDLLFLDGYEHLQIEFNSKDICDKIINICNVENSDRILEVGCGAGFLSREFVNYDYTGVDYSESIIKKHSSMFPNHKIQVANAKKLPFENEEFDLVFCFGLFQYLPNYEYAGEVISEMQRVSKKTVFLGDLKSTKTRKEHFVYPKEELKSMGFEFSNCVYDSNDAHRFNALVKKGRGEK